MKTYFITGANRGIGLGLTKQALAAGNRVIAAARNPDGARDLWELEADYGDRLQVVELDVDNQMSVDAAVAHLSKIDGIDVLINNAGVYDTADKGFKTLELDVVERTFRINTLGPMRVTKALLPWLEKAPKPVVVNMSSKMGSIADNTSGGSYAYRMSKVALNMFNRSLALESPKLTAVVMHPGWVKTAMGGANAPTAVEESTEGLYRMISGLGREANGRFFDYRGQEIPW